ncbi:thioredoxin fold domain-containing protein [Bosea sp. 2RAB26]|uniref:thioredoxin fold domain-containing protein n=1 Tax=Bosea sp. 2RAB26 TaxID=3237476 RepID=UPI003F914B61
MKAIAKWLSWHAGLAALVGMALVSLPLRAAELVMFERDGCIWCARWDREVARVYANTPEGKAAPLRRVDLGSTRADEPGLAAPVRFTPTFVLMDEGREVGRITGYIGDDAFWGLLGKMLAGMDSPSHRTRGQSATMERK